MTYITELIVQYGAALVFAWVLLEQLGLPIPAFPVLLMAGSMSALGSQSLLEPALCAIAACLIADTLWFLAGRRHGGRVLRLMCKLSLTPDSCVAESKSTFDRWGARCLVVSKFIPGFASVVTVMAGATGVSHRSFFFYNLAGTALWVGLGLALGYLFAPAVEEILLALERAGRWGLLLVVVFVTSYIGRKAWIRHQQRPSPDIRSLSASELHGARAIGEPIVLIDVQPRGLWERERIPGSIRMDSPQWETFVQRAGTDSARVVVYCDCPDELSARKVVRELIRTGHSRVELLSGGLSGWRLAGLDTDGS
jgi:membrane protein DedA with SNARE-associated domain/rhodanese-related sulfurtransferase